MVKSLEGKPYEKQLRSLDLLSLEETEERPHCGLQLPHEGRQRGRYRSVLPGDQGQELRSWHEATSGFG